MSRSGALSLPFRGSGPARFDDAPEGLRELVGRRLGPTLAFGALLGAIAFAAYVPRAVEPGVDLLLTLVYLVASWALGALPVGLALCVVEWRQGARPPRLLAHVLAALAGAFVTAVASHGLERFLGALLGSSPLETVYAIPRHSPDSLLFYFWQALFFGGLVTAGRFAQGSALQARDALFVAEQAQANSERSLEEAKLAALQAEVEPEFLLSWLADVEALYGADPVAADARLGAIVDFLRASLAHLRSHGSSVEQEIRVAESWFRAVPANRLDGVTLRFEMLPEAAKHPMPPLVLLPVIRWLIARYPAGRRADIAVRAEPANWGSGALIAIEASPGANPAIDTDDAEWQRVEARMTEFDGEEARMAVQNAPDGGIRVWIELLAQAAGPATATSTGHADAPRTEAAVRET